MKYILKETFGTNMTIINNKANYKQRLSYNQPYF